MKTFFALVLSLFLGIAPAPAQFNGAPPGLEPDGFGFGTGVGSNPAPIIPLSIDGTVTGNSSAATTVVNLTTTKTNDIIVVFSLSAFNIPTVSSVPVLTWTQRASTGTGGGAAISEFWTFAAAPTTYAITVNPGAAVFTTVTAFGINGANTSAPYDTNVSLPFTRSPAVADPATISTTALNTIVFGGFRMGATANPTSGAGYTQISGSNFMLVEYKIVSAAQSSLSVTIGTGVGNASAAIGDAIRQGP